MGRVMTPLPGRDLDEALSMRLADEIASESDLPFTSAAEIGSGAKAATWLVFCLLVAVPSLAFAALLVRDLLADIT